MTSSPPIDYLPSGKRRKAERKGILSRAMTQTSQRAKNTETALEYNFENFNKSSVNWSIEIIFLNEENETMNCLRVVTYTSYYDNSIVQTEVI